MDIARHIKVKMFVFFGLKRVLDRMSTTALKITALICTDKCNGNMYYVYCYNMNCTETVIQLNVFIPQFHRLTLIVAAYLCRLILCQQEVLLERESSRFPGNAVHKTELSSQTLLYQTLYARWNKNDIQHFLKTEIL